MAGRALKILEPNMLARAAYRGLRHSSIVSMSALELKEIVVRCAKVREMPSELWKGWVMR